MAHENCRHLIGAISDYVDDAASQALCEEIERHLEECVNCRVVVDTMKKTVYLVHASTDPAEVPDDVKNRLFKRLELAEFLPKE